MTNAGCNFEAILNQTIHGLGYERKYAHEVPPIVEAPLNIVSIPCHHSCVATESALFNMLNFIDDITGYKIGDLHLDLLVKESQIHQ